MVKSNTSAQYKKENNINGGTKCRNGTLVEIDFDRLQANIINVEGDVLCSKSSRSATGSIFHAAWLWTNSPTNVVRTKEGQRQFSPGIYPGWVVLSVSFKLASEALSGSSEEAGSFFGPVGRSNLPVPPPPHGSYHSMNTNVSCERTNCTTVQWLLKITWNDPSRSVVYYDIEWLKHWRYDTKALQLRREKTEVTTMKSFMYRYRQSKKKVKQDSRNFVNGDFRKEKYGGLVDVNYNTLQEQISLSENDKINFMSRFTSSSSTDELFRLLQAIFLDGAVIVRNVPSVFEGPSAPVKFIGEAIAGSLSHGSLYGDIFHVKEEPDASNVAFTTHALHPHQDLACYESKPGIQLLHCISRGQDVTGGESTLIDAMAAAHDFRKLAPDLFRTLVTSPATFCKCSEDAQMVYQRPHIVLKEGYDRNDMDREITAVHWSPAFEGPLSVPPDRVQPYYQAYAAFERMLDKYFLGSDSYDVESGLTEKLSNYAQDYTWEHVLKPGEILIFNNSRMLHGRRSFTGTDRRLAGAYTNMDDALNTYRILLRQKIDDVDEHEVPNVGHGSSVF